MQLRGIDVSAHQGQINWEVVKPQIDFAILRVGYGDNTESQDDIYFKYNADECTRLGIPFGAYIYSYANTEAHAKSEAEHCLRLLKPYKLSYPIYYDLEDKVVANCGNKKIEQMSKIFCDIMEQSGYFVGIYASLNWFNNRLYTPFYDRYAKWVAQYNNKCTYSKPYGMWQYTSGGSINGINARVDMNYCYVDYVNLINPRNKYSYDNTVEMLIKDGIITTDNMQNWEKMLDGREPLNPDYVRTILERYHKKYVNTST